MGQGDYVRAYTLNKESLSTRIALGERPAIPSALENFARLAVALSQPERGLCLAGAAATLRESIAAPRLPSDETKMNHDLETARRELSKEEQEAAWAEGQRMTLDEAVAYALEESDDY